MKPLQIEPPETHQEAKDDVYYAITLDPTKRDHRILALLINHTSVQGECVFYKKEEQETPCSIAPKFTILGRICNGKCFIDGLTCPLILEYIEDKKSKSSNMNDDEGRVG